MSYEVVIPAECVEQKIKFKFVRMEIVDHFCVILHLLWTNQMLEIWVIYNFDNNF